MWDYYNWYEKTTPKKINNGIKAQSKRGAFSKKWWGKRWIQVLESFRIGARLSRGRAYARKGQVASLEIEKGCVKAKVQGSGSRPYNIKIKLKSFTKKQWDLIIKALNSQPIFTASLLSNEMPEEIEDFFIKTGFPLFPEYIDDVEMNCSCPDWSIPCKHIAAVFYLIGEALDNDPFLLFKIKGLEKNNFLELLPKKNIKEQKKEIIETLPVNTEILSFWGSSINKNIEEDINESVNVPAALVKQLGKLSFWRSNKDFYEEMSLFYKNSSENGLLFFKKLTE